MAEWVANVKDVFVNVMCGKSTDSPKSSITPVSLEGCGEGESVCGVWGVDDEGGWVRMGGEV